MGCCRNEQPLSGNNGGGRKGNIFEETSLEQFKEGLELNLYSA